MEGIVALISLVSIICSLFTLVLYCTKKMNTREASGFGIFSVVLLCVALFLS